jgi:hypothetical protein
MLIVDTAEMTQNISKYSPSEIYWGYNGLDCCLTYDVLNAIKPQLDDVSSATYTTSMSVVAPIMEMMLEGLPVSLTRRAEVEKVYVDRLHKLEIGWQRLCVEGLGLPPDRAKRKGRQPLAINPASPKDVQFLFHEVLGIPEKRKRKKGKDEATVTTDRATLEGFRSYFHAEPFVNFILAMRDASKAIGFLRSTLDPDNHLRCSLNVAGTDTGRLSSSFADSGTGTNLQNISGRMKDIFVAPEGWCFVNVDLGQGDSRAVAAICWEWFHESHGEGFAGAYLDACEAGDLHSAVCKMAWTDLEWGDDPKGWKKVAGQIAYRDKSYRDLAKMLGHGSNYGGLPPTMAGHTKLPVSLVSDFQKRYFSAFPCVVEWQKETLRRLETTRTLTTIFGRRRAFWGDPSANGVRNAAIAYSPQSTTGEFINRGALQLWHHRNRAWLPIRFLLQVHDSLVFLVPTSRLEELIPIMMAKLQVKLTLARGREFTMPLDCEVGWNYGKASEANPYGLMGWPWREPRKPPKPIRNLQDALNTPLGQLR